MRRDDGHRGHPHDQSERRAPQADLPLFLGNQPSVLFDADERQRSLRILFGSRIRGTTHKRCERKAQKHDQSCHEDPRREFAMNFLRVAAAATSAVRVD